MSRNAVGKIKLKIPAGSATMGGTIAPALGQKGVKAKDFVDVFNEKTKSLTKGTPVHVTIYVMKDKSFTFKFNTESAMDRIKKLKTDVLTMDQVREIASEKIVDMFCDDLEKACKTVMGTLKSMGKRVE